MKIVNLPQNTQEWLEFRRGKISGTILSDIYAKRGGRKIGFYQVIAERIGLDPDDENRMDRGLRLEDEAIQMFEAKSRLKVERVGLCVSDFNENVINSPDGLLKNKDGKYTGAVEVKCLSPARHLQAVIENKIPGEFEAQKIQYFVVNDDLEELFFVFYDPRIPSVMYHVIRVTRDEVKDQIEFFRNYQIETIKEIEEIVERLAF